MTLSLPKLPRSRPATNMTASAAVESWQSVKITDGEFTSGEGGFGK